MSDSDQSLNNLRYNQVSGALEGFGGGSPQWTPLTLTNVDPTQVPATRLISTTAPLTGGGNLSADRTLSMPAATNTVDGYLLAVDWITFNAKQAAGDYITALTGDVTAGGPGSVASTLATVNTDVGSFTNATITVNAKGLITAASSGTANVVQATHVDTNAFTTSSTPVSTGLSATITPSSVSKQIKITCVGTFDTQDSPNSSAFVTILRDSTNLASGSPASFGFVGTNEGGGLQTVVAGTVTIVYLDSPATTSPVTYTLAYFNDDGVTTIEYTPDGGTSVMLLEEI